ncbi:MAG: IS481 family transposase [Candidatus Micrarchaeota archaeon]
MAVITVQEKLEILKRLQEGQSVAETAKEFGVSRRTVFYWRKRFDGGVESLLLQKRGPKTSSRKKVDAELEQEILELRLKKKWGYRRIMWHLRRKRGVGLSKNTIRYWLRKHSIPPKRRKRKGKRRGRKYLPNEKVLIDIKEHRLKGVGKVYTYVGIDRCTRRVFAESYRRKTTDNAIDFTKKLILAFGFMKMIRIDNGRQFVYLVPKKRKRGRPKKVKKSRRRKNRYGEFVESLGIRLKFIDFGRPNQNAHIERAIRTLKEEFLDVQRFERLDDLNSKLKAFLEEYNEEREHGGLEGKTPASVWQEKKALSRYAEHYPETVQELFAPNRAKII